MIGREELHLVARRANEVFRAAPLQLVGPVLAVKVLFWALGFALMVALPRVLSLVVNGIIGLFLPAAEYYAIYLVADCYLQLRQGQAAHLRYASLKLPAVSATVWALWRRFLLWGLAAVGYTLAALLLFVLTYSLLHVGAGLRHHSGLPLGWATLFTAASLVAFALLFSRYMFALPLQALWGGSRPDAFPVSLLLAARVRGVVLSIAFVEVLVTSIAPLHPLQLSLARFGAGSWRHEGFLLVETVLVSFAVTWFVLLKTGLLERMAELEQPSVGP